MLLTIAAYAGNSQGIGTSKWEESLDRLDEAKVLTCKQLDLELKSGETNIPGPSLDAYWMEMDKEKCLIISGAGQQDYERIAGAGQEALERADVLDSLQLVLLYLKIACEGSRPKREHIEAAFGKMDIGSNEIGRCEGRAKGSQTNAVGQACPCFCVKRQIKGYISHFGKEVVGAKHRAW